VIITIALAANKTRSFKSRSSGRRNV